MSRTSLSRSVRCSTRARLDGVAHAPHRRERGVEQDAADRAAALGLDARGRRLVAAALLDLDLHLELAAGGQVRDDVLGIDDLDVVVRLDVGGRDRALAGLGELQHHVVAVVQLEHDALQVQQDVDDVFLHAVERRVLVQHAGDLDLGRRVAGHRRQQHAAQRVAQRVAVAALERLHHHLGVERRHALHVDDARLQQNIALHAVPLWRIRDDIDARPAPMRAVAHRLLRIQFDHQAFVDVLAELGAVRRALERARHLLRRRPRPTTGSRPSRRAAAHP